MANSLNQNPIVLTTTQTSYKAAVLATLGAYFPIRVAKILWLAPAINTHQVLIIDPQSGAHLLHLEAVSAYSGQTIPQPQVMIDWSAAPKLWSDFAVVQMDSGELQIWTC